MAQQLPFLPYDILSSVLALLPLKDRLALSSVSHATRAAALHSCFSFMAIRVCGTRSSLPKVHNALKDADPSFPNAIKCVLYLTSYVYLDDLMIPIWQENIHQGVWSVAFFHF
jgi:F-box domain